MLARRYRSGITFSHVNLGAKVTSVSEKLNMELEPGGISLF